MEEKNCRNCRFNRFNKCMKEELSTINSLDLSKNNMENISDELFIILKNNFLNRLNYNEEIEDDLRYLIDKNIPKILNKYLNYDFKINDDQFYCKYYK